MQLLRMLRNSLFMKFFERRMPTTCLQSECKAIAYASCEGDSSSKTSYYILIHAN